MNAQLFVYGTLTDHQIQKKVIGRTVEGVDDELGGYRKSSITINGHSYPDIVKAPAFSVKAM